MNGRLRPVVLSLGGSIILTGKDDEVYLKGLVRLLKRVARNSSLAIVTGGGRTARQYITLGREMGLSEVELDDLGIEVTRLHARLLSHLLAPEAPPRPPTTIPEAVGEVARWPIMVMGGTEPAHTTDGVAALLAERLRARYLVNATRVGGLYESDPKTDPKARLISHMSFEVFERWVDSRTMGEAGQEFVFDRLGAASLARSRIPLLVVDGRDLKELGSALQGKKFNGSRVG